MRYTELLESQNRYLDMFRALYPEGMPPSLPARIAEVRTGLRRQDRVTWYLKWYRLMILVGDAALELDVHNDDLANRLLTKFSNGMSINSIKAEIDRSLIFSDFKHFVEMSVEIPALNKIVWDRQLPHQLYQEMKTLEKEWQDRQDQHISHLYDEPEVFLRLNDEWAWYDLQTHYCSREAKAMGHCGNEGGQSGQTILSLRRATPDGFRPSLTFILHDDGTLGEMKGRENAKPSEKYHDAIVALLRDPRIKGITGGGYKPENNFAMRDLPDDDREEIQANNPMMRDLYDFYEYYESAEEKTSEMTDRFRTLMTKSLDEFGYKVHTIEWDREMLLIRRYNSPEQYMGEYHSYTSLVLALFNEGLPEAFVDRGLAHYTNDAHRIAEAAKRAIFPHAFAELVSEDVSYIVSDDMHPRFDNGKVLIELPFYDYIHNIVGPEALNPLPEDLDDVDEHRDNDLDYLIESAPDPLFALVYQFADLCGKARNNRDRRTGHIKWPKPSEELVNALYEHFKSAISDSFTDDDRRQREFDF